MGRNFKFQVQDSFFGIVFFLEIERFEKRIALSEKKPPLGNVNNMQIFPYNSKGIPSSISRRGR